MSTRKRRAMIFGVFAAFIALRIIVWAWPFATFGVYGDSYQYYVPAGID